MKYQTIIYCAAGIILLLFLAEAINCVRVIVDLHSLSNPAYPEEFPILHKALHKEYGRLACWMFCTLLQTAVIVYTYKSRDARPVA